MLRERILLWKCSPCLYPAFSRKGKAQILYIAICVSFQWCNRNVWAHFPVSQGWWCSRFTNPCAVLSGKPRSRLKNLTQGAHVVRSSTARLRLGLELTFVSGVSLGKLHFSKDISPPMKWTDDTTCSTLLDCYETLSVILNDWIGENSESLAGVWALFCCRLVNGFVRPPDNRNTKRKECVGTFWIFIYCWILTSILITNILFLVMEWRTKFQTEDWGKGGRGSGRHGFMAQRAPWPRPCTSILSSLRDRGSAYNSRAW